MGVRHQLAPTAVYQTAVNRVLRNPGLGEWVTVGDCLSLTVFKVVVDADCCKRRIDSAMPALLTAEVHVFRMENGYLETSFSCSNPDFSRGRAAGRTSV
jgi:hypothetical protein